MKTIDFYGDKLDVVIMGDGQPGIVVRRLVENLGLSWSSQSEKLKDPHYKCSVIGTVGSDEKNREMLILPIKRINAYLYSINPNKVREDLQERIRLYRDECADVLYNYWAKGYAVNQRVSPENTLVNFYESTGEVGVRFLEGMLEQAAKTPLHREIVERIISHIIKEALRAEEIDLTTNRVKQGGKWRLLNREEIIAVITLELEAGAWVGRGKNLPQNEEEVIQMAKDIGRLAYNSSHDASFLIHLYSERFETPLRCFMKTL